MAKGKFGMVVQVKTISLDNPEFDEVGAIIRYEQGELGPQETLELFSHLVRLGHAWTLQGHYGRVARGLIENGWLDVTGSILRNAE